MTNTYRFHGYWIVWTISNWYIYRKGEEVAGPFRCSQDAEDFILDFEG